MITTLANQFSSRGYEVFLVTTNSPKNDYKISENVTRRIINVDSKNIAIRTIKRIMILRSYFVSIQPDCIVSFSTIPNLQAILANIGNKTKIIISERTDPSQYPKSKIVQVFRNVLYPFVDVIVFQTKEAMAYFNKPIKKKGVVIFNPIQNNLPEEYLGIREKKGLLELVLLESKRTGKLHWRLLRYFS